ncbi:MAG TPA: hypothetical protein VFT78_16205 [Hanamia sp.]|nr:hypothetical protein [Hanamia sp.]
MEVHHHPKVEKKNFKEYFLEFLMIFLAVTLGFFAESLREHINDRGKAREYIQSFYEDLKTDTAKVSEIIQFDDEKIAGLSDISKCYDTISQNLASSSCLFRIVKSTISNKPFQITDRTLQQLANAGGFRLLKKEDADTISRYVQAFNNIRDFQSTGYQQAQDDVRKMLSRVIGVKATLQLLKPELKGELLFTHDKALLNEYFNDLIRYNGFTRAQRRLLKDFKDNQIRIIQYLRNKYHFE